MGGALESFYSSLGHSSIPVQFNFSETSLNCTNQSIRAPPIRAYAEVGVIGEQVASKASEQATCKAY